MTRFLRILDSWHEVERLDVAVAEPTILERDKLHRHLRVAERLGADHDPEFSGRFVVICVLTRCHASRDLPIYETRLVVDLGEQFVEQLVKVVFRKRNMDIEQRSAGEEAIEVVLDGENLPIYANRGFVDTVAEEMRTIVERHR